MRHAEDLGAKVIPLDAFRRSPNNVLVLQGPCMNGNERNAIASMISYVASKIGVAQNAVSQAVSARFGVQNLWLLPSHAYEEVIRFLLAASEQEHDANELLRR